MNVAIIPARGGSKRIPGKNIRLFADKPMIAYPITRALESGLFDRIIVTTDSDEIAAVAVEWGAEAPFRRPAELADDHTGMDAVVRHCLEWVTRQGAEVDRICCIYATAPFLRVEDLKAGLSLLERSEAASVVPVAKYKSPIFRSFKRNAADRLEMLWPEYKDTRSQDLPVAYHDATVFYWADARKHLAGGRFYSEDAAPLEIPGHLVQDIDTPEDWQRAEAMWKQFGMDH